MDNIFVSPDLFDDLHTRGINCTGNVRQNHTGMPWSSGLCQQRQKSG